MALDIPNPTSDMVQNVLARRAFLGWFQGKPNANDFAGCPSSKLRHTGDDADADNANNAGDAGDDGANDASNAADAETLCLARASWNLLTQL